MIRIYGSHHLREGGFFRFLFRALQKGGASVVEEPPFHCERQTKRHHEGAWANIEGAMVFFDMSDHVFDFDFLALRNADIYYKANLNSEIARRVLINKQLLNYFEKLRPFTFLPPSLHLCGRVRKWNVAKILPRFSFFHVVGVYENMVASATPDPFDIPNGLVAPHVMHFWIRWHFSNILKRLDPRGLTRVTSRGERLIEDGINVFPNINHHLYLMRMATAQFTVLNTFPHAVYPWKAFESIGLGRPFVLERRPLIEVPDAFRLEEGIHYLEVIPEFGAFDGEAGLNDPRSYRILSVPPLNELEEGLRRVVEVFQDRDRAEEMQWQCQRFASERLIPDFVVQWILEDVKSSP